MKKIAVDAMGGDYAPKAIVEGVNQAISDFSDIEVQLYGDQKKIEKYLTVTERVSIIHTEEKLILMMSLLKLFVVKNSLRWS